MSKFVTLHGFGSGSSGTELNFEIVGGTTQPTNPKENTIWVNTDTEITGYEFTSSTQPTKPIEGMVWILIGTQSPVDFNILKKNNIQIYPLSASQYINGKWTTVSTMSYQNGEWTNWWNGRIYWLGETYPDFTGDIKTSDTISYSDDGGSFTVTNTSHAGGSVYVDDIDVTKYSYIKVNFTDVSRNYANNSANATCYIFVHQDGENIAEISNIHETGPGEYTLDVSSISGLVSIDIYTYTYIATPEVYITITVNKWWLE